VDHLAGCQQLSVVVAAVDTRDEAVDASPDVNGIVHHLPEIMTPDRRRSTRAAREMGAERQEKADETTLAVGCCADACAKRSALQAFP
jgi:hypothetical protein